VDADSELRGRINARVLRYAGFAEEEGLPVRIRQVNMNYFLRTHNVAVGDETFSADSFYCSEIPYLSYHVSGIEICSLHSMDELLMRNVGIPNRDMMRKILKKYALGSFPRYALSRFLYEGVRLAHAVRLPPLSPSRIFFKNVAWPCAMVDSPAMDIVAAVVPPLRVCS
jgi:hypothetical protein